MEGVQIFFELLCYTTYVINKCVHHLGGIYYLGLSYIRLETQTLALAYFHERYFN